MTTLSRWYMAAIAMLVALPALAPTCAAQTFARHEGITTLVAADGFDHPVFLCAAPGDARLFVVEQPGRVRWIEKGKPSAALFADLTPVVKYGGERGLLGLAFHPDYARNGFVFVNYTDKSGDTQVMRYTVKRDRSAIEPSSAKRILTVKQPFANHNGGHLAFGPDGMLYIGMGDGGAGGDPLGNGQNRHALLGKMLRLDVDHGEPYAIPAGNMFKDKARDGAPEIWALGLRNPWRWAFDFAANRLLIADVGQNKYEEVNVVNATTPGLNYGWSVREALHGFGLPRPRPANLVEPVVEYDHDDGCSVTGGYAYRGKAMPALAGTIFFSDFCSGWLRSFRFEAGKLSEAYEWNVGTLGNVSSFGEDAEHELYVVTHGGRIWKLAGKAAE